MENITLYQREHMVPSSGVKVSCIYFLCVAKGHKSGVTSKTGHNQIKQHIQKLNKFDHWDQFLQEEYYF